MPKIGMEQIRKDEVIAATKRCLVKTGFTRLTVKAIAEEAGLSTGIIYHYFKNKEDLLLSVIREAFAQSHEKVMREVEPLTSKRDKLFKHMENIHATGDRQPGVLRGHAELPGAGSQRPRDQENRDKILL